MNNKKILVVGGGLRGIIISDRLSKNYKVDLIEKLPHIGGILFSENWNGFYLDKGIHMFDNVNDEDTKLFQKILKNQPIQNGYVTGFNRHLHDSINYIE